MSLEHFFASRTPATTTTTPNHRETLIASETGSGKSIAYLLPVLQSLKESESASEETSTRTRGPRALILSPTHELCRQLSSFTKNLSHVVKLRTACLSNPNANSSRERETKSHAEFAAEMLGGKSATGAGVVRPVDVMVGTPSRLADLAGVAFEKPKRSGKDAERDSKTEAKDMKDRRRDSSVARTTPIVRLDSVEWIVVDEADVLFGVSSFLFCI